MIQNTNIELQTAVKDAMANGINIEILAREFQTNKSTIQRWADGLANPHPAIKNYILSKIMEISLNLKDEKELSERPCNTQPFKDEPDARNILTVGRLKEMLSNIPDNYKVTYDGFCGRFLVGELVLDIIDEEICLND